MKKIIKGFTQFVNENMHNKNGSSWLAVMDLDISYVVQDTPDEILEVFMDHAQELEDGHIQINLDSVNIDQWNEDDVVSRDEDGGEEIDYSFTAQIDFEFKSSIQDREKIMSILDASFPNNIFSVNRIEPMLNEGDNPAHNFLRKAHKHITGEEPNPEYKDNRALPAEFDAMSDTDQERFYKVADRTRNFRKADVSRAKQSGIAAYYRNNPNRLLSIIEDECFTPGSQIAAEIVDEFVNDDSMTIDQLAQTVSSKTTHRSISPEWMKELLTRYHK